ncbi:hypothetical protein ACIBCN_13535 [Nocardia sp. NPDC051052]|uniref:hypothetical protein n=1 Tax=Nocardia sp. NPDC051052 TaxID=3364322 RepID=UPI0037918129
MNMLRKKMPFVIVAAAAIAGSLALAAPNATAYPTEMACVEAGLGWHAWDGPGYSGQEYVCDYSEAQGFHWQPI